MQAKPAYLVPVPIQDKVGGRARKDIRRKKMGDDGLISPDGVAPIRIVGVSASVIFPCTIKSRGAIHERS